MAIDATMEALRRRGVECEEILSEINREQQLVGFDLAHIWHCNFDWSWRSFQAVHAARLKYVLTPMFYPGLHSGITISEVDEIIFRASRLVPFTSVEAKAIWDFAGRSEATRIIPQGTDVTFHSHYPVKSGVICVSARGPDDKNCNMVREICQRIKVKFVLAQNLSRKELAHAYAGAQIFVNASDSERMSLTIGEALCSDCRVLATEGNWGNEWYPGIVTFPPKDQTKLEHLIRWAIRVRFDDWDYRPNEAARELTWDWVAEQLHQVYLEVLG